MSLKLSVLITANANELKAASSDAISAIAEIGTAAASAGSGLDKLQAELGESAAAASKVETETSEAKTAIVGVGTAAAAAGSNLHQLQTGLSETAAAAVKVESATRSAAAAQIDYRAVIERTIGIGQSAANSNSNRTRELSDYGKALDDIRAKYSPLFAVQRQYLSTLAEIRSAEKIGALPAAEAATALQSLDRSYLAQTAALTGMKDSATGAAAGVGKIGESAGAVKLTAQQMQGLGYQINDVATMLAMGASPFQVIASQAGQVIQVLGEGPGMRGSLAAIGGFLRSLVTPTTAVTAGILALGAGVVMVARSMDTLRSGEDILKSHADVVAEITKNYREAGRAAGEYGAESTAVLQFREKQDREDLAKRLSRDTGAFLQSSNPTGQAITPEAAELFKQTGVGNRRTALFGDAISALAESARDGTPDIIAFRLEISRLASEPGASEMLKREAAAILDASKTLEDYQRIVEQTRLTRERLQRQQAFGDIASARDDFRQFVPNERTQRDEIQRAYNARLGSIGQLNGSDRGLSESMRIAAANDLKKALAEVGRQEEVLRAGREIDLREINARTTAERAAIAAARERANLSGQAMDPAEREARIAHAAAVVYAEDTRRMSDAARERSRSYADMVTSLQTEVATLDMTRGAAGAYQRQQELILQLYRDAEDTGGIVDPAEVQAIKDTTAAAGALTDQIARLNAVRQQEEELRGLISRAGTIGGTDDAARRASAVYDAERRLREQNEDPGSAYGKASISNASKLSDFGDTIRRQAEAWEDWRSAGEDAIDSVVDALASGTADIGDVLKGIASDFTKSFLELAVSNPLKNALLGTSYGTLGDLFNKTAAPTLEDAGVKAFGTVAMTAAVVNLNGSPLGLGALASNGSGAGGAVGAIDRLLNPANGNSAGLAGNSVKAQIANYFSEKGLAPHQVAGILGNVSAESAFNPLAKGDAGQAFGLFQWNDRKNNLFNSIGGQQNLGNVQSQLDFAWKELQTTESPAFKRLLASKDVRGATAAFAGFERPQGYSVRNPEGAMHFDKRLSAAEKSFDEINASAGRMADSTTSTTTAFADTATNLTSGLGGTFASLDREMLRIANDFTPAFGGALQSVLNAFASSLGNSGGFSGGWISALAGSITGGMTGAPGGGDAWAGLRLAGGGPVFGAGTATSDSVPAMLSTGEFVVNARSAAQYRPLLDAINEGRTRQMAGGGYVTPFPSIDVVPFQTGAPSASGGIIINDYRSSDEPAPQVSQRPDGRYEVSLNRKIAEQVGKRGTPANRVMREQGQLRRLS